MVRCWLTFFCIGLFSLAQLEALSQASNGIQLKSYAEYGYNYTSEYFGSLSATGKFPITDYFDLNGGLKFSTANHYAAMGSADVKFPLQKGLFILENRFLYRALLNHYTSEFSVGLQLKYQNSHLRLSAGIYSRVIGTLNNHYNNESGQIFIREPFSLMYSLEASLFKETHPWNLALRVSNHDDFLIERYNEFIFSILGKYVLTNHIDLLAELTARPAGVFHITANFYECYSRLGIYYKW